MALRGDLASVDLAQVFQMLALNQKVGLLSIQSKQLWKVLAFDQRGVTLHHNVHAVLDRVVHSFVRSKRLPGPALEEVRDHASRMGQALTDSLLAGGFLEPDELEDQYRMELEEEIYDLFFCREARFEFFESASGVDGFDGQTDARFFLNCESVVMEAARRIDEWTYITERVPTTDGFYVAVADSIDVDDYGAEASSVFELLDGRRNVNRIVEITGLQNFPVCKAVAQLLDSGAIAQIADEELVALAALSVNDGRTADAIDLYERAVTVGQGVPETYSLAAATLQSAQRYEEAARHLEAEADWRVAAGDAQGAAKKLAEVSRLLPTALHSRERLVALTLDGGFQLSGFDPLAEGKELVELLIEFGDVERVRALLERLLLVAPEDPDLKKALVSVHIKAGDHQRVAELYESIAADLVADGHPLEAVGYLQKILLMDRTRSDISERVRQLYEHDERSRRRTRSLGVLAFLFCLLVVLGASYWFYNQRAEEDFASIDVREMLGHEDFAGAAVLYEEFLRKYPLTTAVARAEAEMQQVESARQLFEARRATDRAARDRELQRIRTEYKREWATHRELFLTGKPEESLAVLNRVRELIGKAGQPEDMTWALEEKVENTALRLGEYLETSDRLASEFGTAFATGDWQVARELALRLKVDYENTSAAAKVHVPVMVSTRPAGARLLMQGKPLVRFVDGRSEQLVTPALVLCADAKAALEVTTQLDGFAARTLTIVARERAEIDVVLEVVPAQRITFSAPIQTGVGTGGGWLAVGLRGGRLGVCRIDGGGQRVIDLPGLKAVDSTPVVDNGRAYFLSNENTIECLALDSAEAPQGWPVVLAHRPAEGLMVSEGRVALVDSEFVLHCWEQATGARVWSLSLDSAPAGPPMIHRRQVFAATVDGRVFVVDAADGKTIGVLRSPDGISTRVCCDGDLIVFGCASGIVRAVQLSTGRVLWEAQVGQSVADGSIALGQSVVCSDRQGNLIAFERETGRRLASVKLDGIAQPGIVMQGTRVFVRLQRDKVRNLPVRDALQAIDTASLGVLWEFESTGLSAGPFGADSLSVGFSSSPDEVVVFR